MNYAQLLLPDFSIILAGYLICRYTALNRSVWQPVESLVYFLELLAEAYRIRWQGALITLTTLLLCLPLG